MIHLVTEIRGTIRNFIPEAILESHSVQEVVDNGGAYNSREKLSMKDCLACLAYNESRAKGIQGDILRVINRRLSDLADGGMSNLLGYEPES